MKVLVVTNMYPSAELPHAGIFVQREVSALRNLDSISELEIVHVDTIASSLRYVSGRKEVSRAVAAFGPDVIHIHYGLTQLIVPWSRIPRVVTFHGSDLAIPWQGIVSRRLARRASQLIVVSEPMREGLTKHGLYATAIPCGVPQGYGARASGDDARQVLGLPRTGVVLGFPSSPGRGEKDYGLFLEVVNSIDGAIGVCLDGVEPADVPTWLKAVDVVVYSSIREGSPVLSKEALTMGTRVAAVPVGDLPEQLRGLSGCVTSLDRHSSSLEAAVREALLQPAPDPVRAAKRFSVDTEARAVADVYRRAIK